MGQLLDWSRVLPAELLRQHARHPPRVPAARRAGPRSRRGSCSRRRCRRRYGIYSGFEHFENVPVREGSEEYLDSEKYELKRRALDGPLLPLVGEAQPTHGARARRSNGWTTSRSSRRRTSSCSRIRSATAEATSSWSSTSTRVAAQRGRLRRPGVDRSRRPRTVCATCSSDQAVDVAHRPQLRRASRPARATWSRWLR